MSLTSYRAAPPRVNCVFRLAAGACEGLHPASTVWVFVTTPKHERGAEGRRDRGGVVVVSEGLFLAGPAMTYSPGS